MTQVQDQVRVVSSGQFHVKQDAAVSPQPSSYETLHMSEAQTSSLLLLLTLHTHPRTAMDFISIDQFRASNGTDASASLESLQQPLRHTWAHLGIFLLLTCIVLASTHKLLSSFKPAQHRQEPLKKVRFECDLGGERSESVKGQLEGTWNLVSYRLELKAPVRITSFPLGRHATGRLTYTPDGYMSVQIMRPGCEHFQAKNPQGGTVRENSRAAAHYMAYCGRYEAFEYKGQKLVNHLLDHSLYPNWLNTTQARLCDFDGDELVLRPQKVPTFMVSGRCATG